MAMAAQQNVALVFVKPHAATPKVLDLVPSFLEEKGLVVERSGSVKAEQIEQQKIIDEHYKAIAQVGMERDMRKLALEEVSEKFSVYGTSVEKAIQSGELCSAVTALEILKVDPSELLKRCLAAGYEKLRQFSQRRIL